MRLAGNPELAAELDRWGRRVFLASFGLLVSLQSFFWLNERYGWVQPGFPESGISAVAAESRVPGDSTRGPVAPEIPKLRDPLAILAGKEVMVVDRKARLVPLSLAREGTDLPVITGLEDEPNRAELLRNALDALNELRRRHYALYARLSELHYDAGGGWVAYLTDNALPILLGRQELEERLRTLALALPELEKMESLDSLALVDLRFAGQIVVRSPYRRGV